MTISIEWALNMETDVNTSDTRWCLQCGADEFIVDANLFLPKINEKVVPVMAYAYVCQKCYATQMDTEQMNAFKKRANAFYERLYASVQQVRNDDKDHH